MALGYPDSRHVDQVDDYCSVRVFDPYCRLEQPTNMPEVRARIEVQNQLTFSGRNLRNMLALGHSDTSGRLSGGFSRPMRGRFAPSPTGFLHLGNARTALVAWLSARKQGGTFVMRVEDLDSQRSRLEFSRVNLDELRWLGLEWDEGPDVGGPHAPYQQSERHGLYQAALERLESYLFECYLSRQELRGVASAPHGGMAPYGPRQRCLNERLKASRISAGKRPSLRFRVDDSEVRFTDLLHGEQAQPVSDFVVRRADGEWAYQLAVVADDITMNISEVVRGDDLSESTAAQLLLYQALEAQPPQYLHVPLLLDADGERLAKRTGSLTLTSLREQGVFPKRVVGLLAYTLGLLESPREATGSELLPVFELAKLQRAPFRLEPHHLEWLKGVQR